MAKPGQFVWFELMTRDMKKAMEFYGAVASWTMVNWDGSTDMPYVMFSRSAEGKDSVGGIMEMQEPNFPAEVPSHFMGYVSVDNADDISDRVRDLGGTVIHGPEDIPKVGRFAILQDPQGGVFAILQSLDNNWEREIPQAGDVSWCELMTTDTEAAFTFYHELFGWTIAMDMDMGGGAIYRMVAYPDSVAQGKYGFAGLYSMTPEMPGSTAWMYYIAVRDLDASLVNLVALGGKILNGPMDVPEGNRVAQCVDSEGTYFGLISIH